MKHIIFLLFSTVCLAQNARVTAYRLTDDLISDGPCSIVMYVKAKEVFYQTYVTAESNNDDFAVRLLEIKKKSTKWKKQHFECGYGTGGDMMPNMLVIKGNNKNDTVFTNYNNTVIIFPNKKASYIDDKQLLKNSFPEEIKDFYDHDFSKQIRSMFIREDDSITADKVFYQGRLATDIFNAGFKQQSGNFRLIKEDSLYDEIERIYVHSNDTIRDYKGFEITVTNRNSGWDIGGFKPGDTEQALRAKYPASTKIQKYYNIRYEDIKRNYFYWVELIGDNGTISYFIKDHTIDKIELRLKTLK